ncbi:DUF1836 domain-containing protein [Herbivorax sp. ANBcel31]|uniref:DUF1836 domain-containing protein n=1 Tax=Herbivorax sp. ANBcel31 TaxID=3069754 RepID=UPI0027B3F6FD|nr:DUF1836 domain-containing protein [Herbivorax sp. ANBcel31]MDQ2087905.1 DUF1836 domain-containing protein [Herbivorax sp. ANBcel31]
MFDKIELEEIIKELSLTDNIKLDDIPNLELYIDQVTSFINEKFDNIKRDDNDKTLTKTMINNYTKAKVLMPPKNKKYSKDHIILLILVYKLKNILSINDIRSLFEPILNDISIIEDNVISLEDIYSTYTEIIDTEFSSFGAELNRKFELIKEKADKIENDKEIAELFLTIVMLVAQANAHKRLAEKLIDKYFSNPTKC